LRQRAPIKSSAEMPFMNCSAMTITFPDISPRVDDMHMHVHPIVILKLARVDAEVNARAEN
jgi:hypothetical protein